MEEDDKKIKKETTIDELNSFFSNVSFDYYNIPMAMLICFYKNNFNPMKQNDIYKNIISNPDYKEKLRKTNGKKYTRISSAVQRTILYDLIFKKVEKDKNESQDDSETKYSIVLNEIIDYWKDQASAMEKDVIVKVIEKSNLEEKKQLERLRTRKKKTFSNESVSTSKTKPKLLNRKKKRFSGEKRKFRKKISTSNNRRGGIRTRNSSTKKREKFDSFDDAKKNKMYNIDSDDNEISLDEDDDEDYTNYRVVSNIQNKNKNKTNYKQKEKEKEKESKLDSEESSEKESSDENESYQYNESNRNRTSKEETMNEIFDNSIYDIWPKLNEQKLEVVIDGYKKLNNKINLIIHKLEDLINIKSKFYEQMADEDKLNSEKEREKICKVYNNIKKRIEKQNQIKSVQDKVLNELNFSREKKSLLENANNYLVIYEETYKNLSQVMKERTSIFEFLEESKKEVNTEINTCEKNLMKFIANSSLGVHKTNVYLKRYPRKYYDKALNKAIDHLNDMYSEKKTKINKELNYKSKDDANILNHKFKNQIKPTYFKQKKKVEKKQETSKTKNSISNNHKHKMVKKHKFKKLKKINPKNNNQDSNKSTKIIEDDETTDNHSKDLTNQIPENKTVADLVKNNFNHPEKKTNKNHNQTIILNSFSQDASNFNIGKANLLKEPIFLNNEENIIESEEKEEKDEKDIKDTNSNGSQKTASVTSSIYNLNLNLMDQTKVKEPIMEENENKNKNEEKNENDEIKSK